MRVIDFVYDSASAPPHVTAVLDAIETREEDVRILDVSGDASRRDASLAVREAVRIGDYPEELYGDDGTLDFSPGALVTEAPTGRRTLHVGADALDALD
ncbi:MAG: hypothetical protein ABEJ68_11360 [Halobacteriaceae archaeon]